MEERIEVLIQSIDFLTAVINRLWDQKDEIRGIPAPPISAEPPKAKTKKTKAKKKDVEKPTEAATEEPKPPLVSELEGLCMDIVREKGPKLKKQIQKQIKNTIKAHGGALISDCPAENLPALKTALEAL